MNERTERLKRFVNGDYSVYNIPWMDTEVFAWVTLKADIRSILEVESDNP